MSGPATQSGRDTSARAGVPSASRWDALTGHDLDQVDFSLPVVPTVHGLGDEAGR